MNNTALAQQPEKLAHLIERAAAALAKATNAAEVLEAKAEAAALYDAAKTAARFARAKQAHDTIKAACHKAGQRAADRGSRADAPGGRIRRRTGAR